ncbi:hypothetical protein ABZ953_06480 [Streptomyces sp. NPDC046465]|uniref:hypothetical protein n=1 Tax=Streptomyces sp. NPDC046465 TaxID=3155810 RepID=UPI0033F9D062
MSRTRVSQAVIILGGIPEDIVLDVHDGHTCLGLGTAAAINIDDASPEVLYRAAALLAEAAAKKAQLRAVA